MKTFTITLMALFSLTGGYAMIYNNNIAQYFSTSVNTAIGDNNDTSTIVVSDSEITIVDNDTTVKVTISENAGDEKDKSISTEEYEDVNVEIIEGAKSTRIILHKNGDTIKNYEMNYDFPHHTEFNHDITKKKENNNKTFSFTKKKRNRFKGHWSGFEMGLNNYFTDDYSVTPDDPYMELNTGRSWNFNLNFAQISIPLANKRFGLVSGLGFEWCNYHFSNQNTIEKDPVTHTIRPRDLSEFALKKNKLKTTYLTTPLLMEVQLGNSSSYNKRVAISGGLIAGLKLGSHTKYKTSDEKQKDKDDFYLQSFRYGFTARVHYDLIGFYFNYYNVPLFVDGKGPELYPFAAGVVFSFN